MHLGAQKCIKVIQGVSEKSNSICDETIWLNMTQATDYLQVSRSTLYRLIEAGDLPSYRITGTRQRRFKRSDLDQLMVLEEPGNIDEDAED